MRRVNNIVIENRVVNVTNFEKRTDVYHTYQLMPLGLGGSGPGRMEKRTTIEKYAFTCEGFLGPELFEFLGGGRIVNFVVYGNGDSEIGRALFTKWPRGEDTQFGVEQAFCLAKNPRVVTRFVEDGGGGATEWTEVEGAR